MTSGEQCNSSRKLDTVRSPGTRLVSTPPLQNVPRQRLDGGFTNNVTNNRNYANNRNNRGNNISNVNNNNNNGNQATINTGFPRTLHCQNCGGSGHLMNVCQQPLNTNNSATNNSATNNTASNVGRPMRDRQPTERFGYNNNCIMAEGTDGNSEIIGFTSSPSLQPKRNEGALSCPNDEEE